MYNVRTRRDGDSGIELLQTVLVVSYHGLNVGNALFGRESETKYLLGIYDIKSAYLYKRDLAASVFESVLTRVYFALSVRGH